MPKYQANPGEEDRHGEMTGAISINMVLCMPAIAIFAIFIGPMFLSTPANAVVSVTIAIVLPIAMLVPSRWIWARISDFMDKSDW